MKLRCTQFVVFCLVVMLCKTVSDAADSGMLSGAQGQEAITSVERFVPAQSTDAQWWDRWSDEYPFLRVGSTDRLGPLALPGIQTQPIGVAYVFGSPQPDLVAKVNGKLAPGLYVIPWLGSSGDGVPFFGTPVPVNIPINHPLIENGSLNQVGPKIHALWIEGQSMVHGVLNPTELTIAVVEQVALPRLPSSPRRLQFVVREDGRVEIVFELGDGTPWYPPGQDRASGNFSPYDGAGIWQGGPRYRYLYAITYPALLSGQPSNLRLFTPTMKEVRFDMGQITPARLSSGAHTAEIVVGSRFGPFYYYPTGITEPTTSTKRHHLVGHDGNMLRQDRKSVV